MRDKIFCLFAIVPEESTAKIVEGDILVDPSTSDVYTMNSCS